MNFNLLTCTAKRLYTHFFLHEAKAKATIIPVRLGTIYENSFRMGRLTSIHPRLIKHRISIKVVNQIDNRDHCEARQMASLPIKAIRFILAPQVGI